ncbi:MAG TPA: hypothetical protein VF774_25765 [Pseudoduganella sp.]|jgi:hypothetical protein
MNQYEQQNRERLIRLVTALPSSSTPQGWQQTGTFAIGGLSDIGFSKNFELLLIISSSGRGVIDCTTGEKIARDDEVDGDWYLPSMLQCQGIGPLKTETVQIAGLQGGGLPISNQFGESLTLVSPSWPRSDLIFCAPGKSPLIEGHQTGCEIVGSYYEVRAFGFSWTGNSFVIATSSDVVAFKRTIAAR